MFHTFSALNQIQLFNIIITFAGTKDQTHHIVISTNPEDVVSCRSWQLRLFIALGKVAHCPLKFPVVRPCMKLDSTLRLHVECLEARPVWEVNADLQWRLLPQRPGERVQMKTSWRTDPRLLTERWSEKLRKEKPCIYYRAFLLYECRREQEERYFGGESNNKNAAPPRCHFKFVKWDAEEEEEDGGAKELWQAWHLWGRRNSVSLINSHARQLNLEMKPRNSTCLWTITATASEWHITTKLWGWTNRIFASNLHW